MVDTTEDVWTAFRQRLYDYIRARSRSSQDAEDILQDVFEKVHRHMGTLEETANLAAWLYRVTTTPSSTTTARNSHHRPRKSQRPPSRPTSPPRSRVSPLSSTISSTRSPPPTATRSRSPSSRGLTQQEMGQKLGLSTSGAKSRVQRGRAMVRDQLLNCCHIELDQRRHVIDYQPTGSGPWPDDCSCAAQAAP